MQYLPLIITVTMLNLLAVMSSGPDFVITVKNSNITVLLLILIPCLTSCMAQSNGIDYGSNLQAGQYANVNGIKLYYETCGSGSPIIMLHGKSFTPVFTSNLPLSSA